MDPQTSPRINLFQQLQHAATFFPDNGVFVYPPGHIEHIVQHITYSELFQDAIFRGSCLRRIQDITTDSIILIHLDNHADNIKWFWATIVAGFIPAMSTPFTSDQRQKHLLNLRHVLRRPIVITHNHLLEEFATLLDCPIYAIESLTQQSRWLSDDACMEGYSKLSTDIAVLMLTSGSTGNAKAVTLRHGQIVAAIAGKSAHHNTGPDDVFLNWIGMDHVANLTEIHLHALILGANQFHVQAQDLVSDPIQFLCLIDRHRVSYTFAPNFFLASVKAAFETRQPDTVLDISCLRRLISGGEANATELCSELTKLLGTVGAQHGFIVAAFGMTETCAGSIYGYNGNSLEISHGREFMSVGRCIPGITMRIARNDMRLSETGEVGSLEVHGPVVFHEYFNNPEATISALTSDGFFKTGDLGFLDEEGNLHIVGREKETIIINGLKYYPHEIEAAIEDEMIPGVTPSYTAIFPHRAPGMHSESLCVVYLPSFHPTDDLVRLSTWESIRNVVMRYCTVLPYCVIPLTKEMLPKSALGKLSRRKIQNSFEVGLYDAIIKHDAALRAQVHQDVSEGEYPRTAAEVAISKTLRYIDARFSPATSIHSNLFLLGFSSLEMIKLKSILQRCSNFPQAISITTILNNPTIHSLAAALDQCTENQAEYDPVVVLRAGGDKPPLWLVHPGNGEVLIFLNLATHIADRPVYALRARGFAGEPFFASLAEMTASYTSAIKRVQPTGPYAIAGYSFGGTVAFEVAKALQSRDDQVSFLAVIDQQPHIKQRMRHAQNQNDWTYVLLYLARMLGLLSDEQEQQLASRFLGMPSEDERDKAELVDQVLAAATRTRIEELGLDNSGLMAWTSLARNSHAIAVDYEPVGHVPALEVFYGDPAATMAASRKEWKDVNLARWRDFAKDVKFHRVRGDHYTLLAAENASSFWQVFSQRLQARGV